MSTSKEIFQEFTTERENWHNLQEPDYKAPCFSDAADLISFIGDGVLGGLRAAGEPLPASEEEFRVFADTRLRPFYETWRRYRQAQAIAAREAAPPSNDAAATAMEIKAQIISEGDTMIRFKRQANFELFVQQACFAQRAPSNLAEIKEWQAAVEVALGTRHNLPDLTGK